MKVSTPSYVCVCLCSCIVNTSIYQFETCGSVKTE